MTAWHTFDAHDWRAAVVSRPDGAAAGVRAALARIARLDRDLNAFAVVLADEALDRAAELDEVAPADRGPLHGVPVAVKSEIDVAGVVTTYGTRANSTPAAADARVVRLLRDAGAVIIGTTRMPEFGAWPFTQTGGYGVTRNPHDQSRTPGGSSGGSAAAVAAGLVPVALGGDGGGSIRIPAANCGLFGLKPQRGRVSASPNPHLWHDSAPPARSPGPCGTARSSTISSAALPTVTPTVPDPSAPWPRPSPARRPHRGNGSGCA
jgi:amidase